MKLNGVQESSSLLAIFMQSSARLSLKRCLWPQNNGELAAAEALCLRLLDFGAASKERAKALLREIRSIQVWHIPGTPSLLIFCPQLQLAPIFAVKGNSAVFWVCRDHFEQSLYQA